MTLKTKKQTNLLVEELKHTDLAIKETRASLNGLIAYKKDLEKQIEETPTLEKSTKKKED